eukprot:6211870-Pleurochrysis_carterae.AAC.1
MRVLPAAGAVQIDPAGTGTQPHVSMRLCKEAPHDWWVVDDGSTASSVTDVQGGEHDGQMNDEDDVYIVEQIDAARQRKGHWEYRVIWEGPIPREKPMLRSIPQESKCKR